MEGKNLIFGIFIVNSVRVVNNSMKVFLKIILGICRVLWINLLYEFFNIGKKLF